MPLTADPQSRPAMPRTATPKHRKNGAATASSVSQTQPTQSPALNRTAKQRDSSICSDRAPDPCTSSRLPVNVAKHVGVKSTAHVEVTQTPTELWHAVPAALVLPCIRCSTSSASTLEPRVGTANISSTAILRSATVRSTRASHGQSFCDSFQSYLWYTHSTMMRLQSAQHSLRVQARQQALQLVRELPSTSSSWCSANKICLQAPESHAASRFHVHFVSPSRKAECQVTKWKTASTSVNSRDACPVCAKNPVHSNPSDIVLKA